MVEGSDAIKRAAISWHREALRCARDMVEAGDASMRAVAGQQYRPTAALLLQPCARHMVEGNDAAATAVTSQQWEALRCASGMVEASDATMRAVTSQQWVPRRCA